jgi:hypothetical protein
VPARAPGDIAEAVRVAAETIIGAGGCAKQAPYRCEQFQNLSTARNISALGWLEASTVVQRGD